MQSSKKDLFYFFFKMDESAYNLNSWEFLKQWRLISNHNFDAKELAIIINKTGAINNEHLHHLLRSNMHHWEDQALKKIKDFNAQNLSLSLHGYAKMRVLPTPEFLEAWEQKTLSVPVNGRQEIKNFNTQSLANSLYAFAVLAIKPSDEFIHAWAERADTIIKSFTQQEINNSLYALAILKAAFGIPPPKVIDKMRLLSKPIEKQHKYQLKQASLTFGWKDKTGTVPEDKDIGPSEAALQDLFSKSGYPKTPQPCTITTQLNTAIDLPLAHKDTPVLVELDGHYHFIYAQNPDRSGECRISGFNGGTILKTSLLTKLALNAIILRMPYTVASYLLKECDTTQGMAISEQIMLTTEQLEPGAYYTDFDENDACAIFPFLDEAHPH